jgi:hypothetical protein
MTALGPIRVVDEPWRVVGHVRRPPKPGVASGPDMTSDYHNLRPADPRGLERWREDTAQREEEFARERRQSEREQRRAAEAAAASECAILRAELANLRAELDQRRHAEFEAIAEAAVDHSNNILDRVEALTQRMRAELFDKIDSKFAALQARVDAVLPETKCAFRFARERDDEVSELPNPLPPRRAIN